MSIEDQPNTVLDVYTPFAWVQEVGGSNFTKAQADQLYLRKTVEDTDPNIANFTAGIKTNSITSVAGNISLGQTTTTTQDPGDNTTKIATTAWVKLQGYLTTVALAGYATEAWVLGKNYITASALAGYATETYVTTRGYITSAALAGYALESWVNSAITTALVGYATETYVTTRGYITASALVGYATETYVTTRGYITTAALAGYALESWVTAAISSALTGYATETYVTTRGYITASALVGYATETYVTTRGYITSAALAGYALESWVTAAISSALTGYATETYVTTRGYITASALVGYATETYVTTRGYITSAALAGYALESWVNSAITTALTGYATETYVTTRGYITASALVGYATETYVTTRGYITTYAGIFTSNNNWSGTNSFGGDGNLTCTTPTGTSTQVVNAEWVIAKAYITASALTGYATETYVTTRGYITSAALTPYVLTTTLTSTLANYGLKSALNTWAERQTFSGGVQTNSISSISGNVSLEASIVVAPTTGDNTSRIPSTSWVNTAITNRISALTFASTNVNNLWTALQRFSLGIQTNTISSYTAGNISIGASTTTAPSAGDNSTRIPTTEWITTELSAYGNKNTTNYWTLGQWFQSTIYPDSISPYGSNPYVQVLNAYLTGVSNANTPDAGDNSTKVATTAWVRLQGFAAGVNTATAYTWSLLQTFGGGIKTNTITSIAGDISIGQATTVTQIVGTSNSTLATTAFVLAQGFVKTTIENTFTVLQQFNLGIKAEYLYTNSIAGGGDMNIASDQKGGWLKIGDNSTRNGGINIGTRNAGYTDGAIKIGNSVMDVLLTRAKAETQATGNNTTFVATTAFVRDALFNYIPVINWSNGGLTTLGGRQTETVFAGAVDTSTTKTFLPITLPAAGWYSVVLFIDINYAPSSYTLYNMFLYNADTVTTNGGSLPVGYVKEEYMVLQERNTYGSMYRVLSGFATASPNRNMGFAIYIDDTSCDISLKMTYTRLG
jgi:hypothetical protein